MISVYGRRCLHRLVAAFSLVCGVASGAQANDGVPALLQFAEQYRSATSSGSEARTDKDISRPKVPSSGLSKPKSTLPTGDSATLRHALKQRDTQLSQQQARLREQEKQLRALRQSLSVAEERLKSLEVQKGNVHPAPLTTVRPADLAPLQQLVGRLRDAASGSPDAKRSAELIAQAQEQAAHSRSELHNTQAQVRVLKLQVGDLQKQLQSEGKNNERTKRADYALQAKLDAAQAQLNEKTQVLQAAQQQVKEAEAVRAALAQQLNALQKSQEERLQHVDKKQAAVLAELKKKVVELEAQLEGQKKARKDLQMVAEKNEAALSTLRTDKLAMQAQQDALQLQVSASDARLVKQDQEVMRLQDDIKVLRERAKWLVKPDVFNDAAARQAYAAGSALGRDIIEMLDERKEWGVHVSRPTVLAGVVDAFLGQYQLTTDVLASALADSELQINQARDKISSAQKKEGESFIATFKKKKGAMQSPSGFWYQIDYAGDEPVAPDAIVDIVVKEMLTDGTVIQDMDTAGNVLSQPLNDYPPLFREAIGYLRNHGTMIMVVPPELAYGEAGFSPKVPPNATMIYELRIVETSVRKSL